MCEAVTAKLPVAASRNAYQSVYAVVGDEYVVRNINVAIIAEECILAVGGEIDNRLELFGVYLADELFAHAVYFLLGLLHGGYGNISSSRSVSVTAVIAVVFIITTCGCRA